MAVVDLSSIVYDGREGKKIHCKVGKWIAGDGYRLEEPIGLLRGDYRPT